MEEKQETKVTSLRLPQEKYEKIERDAKQQKRSITKQIEYMIDFYYDIKNKQN